jgi:hypothetical protein
MTKVGTIVKEGNEWKRVRKRMKRSQEFVNIS